MLVLAEPQKVIGTHLARQTEPSRADPKPFPRHPLALIVVVANAKVFLEVFSRVRQIVLRLGCDHTTNVIKTVRSFCVVETSS